MSTSALDRFSADPVASHSGQFPLGRHARIADLGVASGPTIRPWGLGGMRPARQQGDPLRDLFAYDHHRQIAVDALGRALTAGKEPTAVKNTNNDGDEGPSEDFSYDYCPDSPYGA